MQLAVHAHLQMLRQNDVFACILVAVLLVQLPDTAPRRGAVFLAGAGVFLTGVVEQNRAAIEQQENTDKLHRVRCPVQRKWRFGYFGELRGKVKDGHSGRVAACHQHSQPDDRYDKRRPHWGGAAK